MSKVSFDFSGENYIVTGASSGMGRQVAVELASAGANVLAIARNKDRLAGLKSEYPARVFTASVDVCDYDGVEKAVASFVTEHGKLNGCVHAAGICSYTTLRAYDNQEAHNIMEISFWAGINLTKLITKNKYGNKGTSMVLFSSVCANSSEKGMFAYAAAKAAVNSSIKSLAKEIYAKGHRINSIMPGWVEASTMTASLGSVNNLDDLRNQHLLGFGKAEDVTGTVLFLLSDKAKWITGTSIVVDGGFLA